MTTATSTAAAPPVMVMVMVKTETKIGAFRPNASLSALSRHAGLAGLAAVVRVVTASVYIPVLMPLVVVGRQSSWPNRREEAGSFMRISGGVPEAFSKTRVVIGFLFHKPARAARGASRVRTHRTRATSLVVMN